MAVRPRPDTALRYRRLAGIIKHEANMSVRRQSPTGGRRRDNPEFFQSFIQRWLNG